MNTIIRTVLAGVTAVAAVSACALIGVVSTGDESWATDPVVNCNNESANDGGDTPERDITPEEWSTYCETPAPVVEPAPEATPIAIEGPLTAPCAPSRLGCPPPPPVKGPKSPCYDNPTLPECPVRGPVPPVTYPHYEGNGIWAVLGADQDPCLVYYVAMKGKKPVSVEPDDVC